MIIYKATNKINDKGYIGFTEDLAFRKWTHFNDAKNGSDLVFHRAIRKYGEDAFTWEVLTESDTREEAGQMEIVLIEAYGTFKNGYNSTTGGEWGWTVSDATKQKMSDSQQKRRQTPMRMETRRKISLARTGKVMSEASKRKMSATKRANPTRGRLGIKHTEETKRKIRESCKKNANPWNKGKTWDEETRRKISEGVRRANAERNKA